MSHLSPSQAQNGSENKEVHHLAVKPPGSRSSSSTLSAPTASLDGETLRSRSSSWSSHTEHVELCTSEEALRPDKGTEADFEVDSNPFAFSPGQLNKLLNPKNLSAFKALGGLAGLERGLRTDVLAGLSVDETTLDGNVAFADVTAHPLTKSEIEGGNQSTVASSGTQYQDRLRVFKDNRLPQKKPTSIFKLLWLAYNDKILILLSIAAIISLALGLYETFSNIPSSSSSGDTGPSVDWVEGLAICVAIIIVVLVTAFNDWQKERQFVLLNTKKEDREIKVIRSGKSIVLSVHDITAGDVLHIEPGDLIPADGIFIQGHNVRCDESSATGESDQMKKTPGSQVADSLDRGIASVELDPFILSGSKVLEGVGTYLVTSVGVNSSFGKTMMAARQDTDPTPLQVKLNGLAGAIAKLGSSAAILLLVVLLIKFLANLSNNHDSPAVKASTFMDILIVAITIIVVAVPEGLPLAVTLALAYATTRMLKENNLVRILRSCETMGNATTICSDKTGTLTQNVMTVVRGMLGSDANFQAVAGSTADDEKAASSPSTTTRKLSEGARQILRQSVVLNSTAFEGEENGVQTFIGSKTETALLLFARDHLGVNSVAEERASASIAHIFPFDSNRKCMGVVIALQTGRYRLLVKGAAEILLGKATFILDSQPTSTELSRDMTDSTRSHIAQQIDDYAQHSLRTIALLYRDFESWPPTHARHAESDRRTTCIEDVLQGMTFIGFVGIQDPIRSSVPESVKRCQSAGVTVRMVTGDNVSTAKAIAIGCGINTDEGIVMEGPHFRQLSDNGMDEILPRLQVLARCSPEDKRILITRLKHLGETVAVTGDGTNDAPALKAADIGFAMGIAGTEVAKEASSIILMDDNFSSIVKAMMWGRAVNDAVAKFLQFQITVNITAVLLAFVSAVADPAMHSVLTAVQLLWVNLIMDTFAALALATDAPTEKILDRKPAPKSAPLITTNMWKMIIGQAIYQLIVTFVLHFAGMDILGYANDSDVLTRKHELDTMVFNTFVWMQIFNEFNNRRLDNRLNIFEGVHRNWFFIGINALMIGGQVMIIFVGGEAFTITRINGGQWAICLLCALFCLPWAIVLRCIPDKYAAAAFGAVQATLFLPLARAWRRSTSSRAVRYVMHMSKRAWNQKEDHQGRPPDVESSAKSKIASPVSPASMTVVSPPRQIQVAPPIMVTSPGDA